jgi:hypothetical protein
MNSQPINQQAKPVVRCKWCIKRVGYARIKLLDGHWATVFTEPLVQLDYTDGICPECFALEKKRLESLVPLS